jgi:Domain of unknown function (DUF3576)
MTTRIPLIAVLLIAAATLAACGGPSGPPAQANYAGLQGPQPGDSSILGDNGLDLGIGNQVNHRNDAGGGGLGVNAYLWRGALDTLGFMPLASADPFGGVIITDWYTPGGTSDERFKATAYILGRQLRSDGIRVAIFRQVLQNGQWVDAPVSPVTVNEIEDKVLARARQLREQSNPG